jgi:WD40 repeat protein
VAAGLGPARGQQPAPGIVAVFKGHTAAVSSLAFSPDGKLLLTGSFDHSLKLWEVPTGKEVKTYAGPQGHQHMVVSVAFTPDGKTVASGGVDNRAYLWEVPSTSPLRLLRSGAEQTALAVSADGTRLATAAKDGVIRVYGAGDFKPASELKGHTGPVTSVSFSGNGQLLASGGSDHTVRFWNLAKGQQFPVLGMHGGAVTAVCMHPNNSAAYSGGDDGQLKFWQISNPPNEGLILKRVVPVSGGAIHVLALTPDGGRIVTAGADKVVRLWNVGNGNREREFSGATAALHAVAVSRNNALLAAGGDDKTVRLYLLGDGRQIGAVPAPAAIRGLTFSPNNLVLSASCTSGAVQVWNVAYNPGQPPPADFFKPLQAFTHDAAANAVAIAPDNTTVYSGSTHEVRAWRLTVDTPTRNFGHPNIVDVVAFDPAGTRLATGCHDGKVRIFDTGKGAQMREINAHPTKEATMVYALAWTRDGKQLASAGFDNSIKLWDAASGNLVREFKSYKMKDFEKGHRDSVLSIALSPDGKYLASGSGGQERLIKIWRVADGSVVRDLDNAQFRYSPPGKKESATAPPSYAQSHPGWVNRLYFTRDGRRLLSAGDAPLDKGYLAIWDAESGKMLHGEELPLGTIYSMAVSPDETLLALGAGARGKAARDLNLAYLLRMPLAAR